MNPARALDQVLRDGEARSYRRTDTPLMRWVMIAVAVLGINASFMGATLHLERTTNREARMRVKLVGEGFSARLDTMLANVDHSATQALPIATRLLADGSPGDRREAAQLLEQLFAGSPVGGGAIVNAGGDLIASFGAAGPAASLARSRLPALSTSGNIEAAGFDGVAFFRLTGEAREKFIIFHRRLAAEGGEARLLLAIPFNIVRAAALRFAPEDWPGALLLFDETGTVITTLAGETGLTPSDIHSPKRWQSAATSASLFFDARRVPLYFFEIRKPDRTFSIVVFEPRATLLALAPQSAVLIELSVYSGASGVLILAFLVWNEWRRRDETLEEFARFTRMSQKALRLTGAYAVYWRPREQEARFSSDWVRMLGLEAKNIGRGFDVLTRRLHPDDKDAALEGYQKLARGEAERLSRTIRLRRTDGAVIAVEEMAGVADAASLNGKAPVHNIVILHRPVSDEEETI